MSTENRVPVIKTVDLKKHFKLKDGALLHAVDGINIEIYEGETLGVVGESGCGKSTLGRTILKLIEPTSGQIYFNGEEISKYSIKQMRRLRKEMQIISRTRMLLWMLVCPLSILLRNTC